jgi:hypothetical protein
VTHPPEIKWLHTAWTVGRDNPVAAITSVPVTGPDRRKYFNTDAAFSRRSSGDIALVSCVLTRSNPLISQPLTSLVGSVETTRKSNYQWY